MPPQPDLLSLPALAARVTALEASKPWGPLLPFLLGCLVTAATLAAAAAAMYWTWRQQGQQRRRLAAAAELAALAEDDEAALQRLLGDALPSWVASPDSARVEWMNALARQLWPHVEPAARKLLLKSGLLERLLNSSTFWRPRMLWGATVAVQALVLGQEPPLVTGARTVGQAGGGGRLQGEALMEFSFAWRSRLEVKLLVMLLSRRQGARGLRSLLSSASRVKVSVSNLMARGTMRISLKPLLDELPVAGGIKVSFLGLPEFSYHTSVLGGNPYILPGVQQLIDSFLKENVLRPFTFPDGYKYTLVTRSLPGFERPEGMLQVTVVEASGVPRMDLLGKADPYVRLWIRDSRKLQTGIKSRTLSPRWEESFMFLVHSTQHQALTLELFDSDLLRPDDLVGRVSLPLRSMDLVPGAENDLWLPVLRPHNGKRGYGGSRSSSAEQPPQHVSVTAVSNGAAGRADTPTAVAAREDSAARILGTSAALQPQTQSPSVAAAAAPGASEPSTPRVQGVPRTQQRLQHVSPALAAMQQLRQLAQFRSKGCQLHIVATYLPLTEHEIAAVTREAGRQQRGEAMMPRASTLASSPRIASMLRSGVLYVYLDRASNLGGRLAQGFTRNMKVKVRVGGIKKSTERGKVSFLHRSNPVFDETVELIVDGATAQQSDLEVHVEIWTQHFLRSDRFKGRVNIPLRHVIERRRLRDTWPLQDAPQGSLTMELSWLSALAM